MHCEENKKDKSHKIIANHISAKGFLIRIYREFSKFNSKKINKFFSIGKRLELIYPQRGHTKVTKYLKVFSKFISNQGYANPNQNKLPPPTY
jgi:hypothetical protein